MRIVIILLFFVFSAIESAAAKPYKDPVSVKVYSPNGDFFIRTNPKYNRIDVLSSVDESVVLWTLYKDIGLHRYFISNDGKRIFIIKDKFCHKKNLNAEAVSIYTEKGLLKSISYKAISKPHKVRKGENGPKGLGWMVWRNEQVVIENNQIVITVFGKEKQRIDMEVDVDKLIKK